MTALLLCALLAAVPCSAGQFRVTTWNMHDFPSGVHNLRKPEVEPQRVEAAATVLRAIAPDVLLVQEIRDEDACRRLAEAITPDTYRVVVCSDFRDQAGMPTFQQVAILSRLPTAKAYWKKWETVGLVDPARGFAFAMLAIEGRNVAFYCVHLKSNLITGGNRERQVQLNILKRELAVEQLLRQAEGLKEAVTNGALAIVVGGDFNTNVDGPLFVSERTLELMEGAGYSNCFRNVARQARVTCPAQGGYPDATFDYLFFSGLGSTSGSNIIDSKLSDHRPVTCDLTIGDMVR